MAVETMKKPPCQEKHRRVQSTIRVVVLVVFLGWIFIWIMSPTNTYKQIWLPQLRAKTTSTYLGTQGLFLIQQQITKFTLFF